MKNHKVKLLDERGDNELTANHQPERAGLGKVAAFFGLGSLINTTFSLVTAATQDILAETYFPTSTVLIADTLPALLVSLIVPYFMQRIPYVGRIALVYLLNVSALIMLALVKQLYWKLIGVVMISFAASACEVTVLSLTSFHGELTLTAFSAGTGVGFAVGPLYYTGVSWHVKLV